MVAKGIEQITVTANYLFLLQVKLHRNLLCELEGLRLNPSILEAYHDGVCLPLFDIISCVSVLINALQDLWSKLLQD
jgi:hypothetical protein